MGAVLLPGILDDHDCQNGPNGRMMMQLKRNNALSTTQRTLALCHDKKLFK